MPEIPAPVQGNLCILVRYNEVKNYCKHKQHKRQTLQCQENNPKAQSFEVPLIWNHGSIWNGFFFHKNASTGNNTGLHFCIYKNINLQVNNSWRQTILMDQLSNMDLICGQHVCNTNFGPFQHLKSQHKECSVHCKAYNRGNCITKRGEARRKLTREPQTLILTQWHTRRRKRHFIKRLDLSLSLFFCQIKLHLLNSRTLSCTEWKRSNAIH